MKYWNQKQTCKIICRWRHYYRKLLDTFISFLDPRVLLKRLTINELVEIGNEGLHGNDPHTCCFCQKILSSRLSIQQHLRNSHLKTKKMLCDSCPKYFSSRHAISEHVKIHRKNVFACNVCDYTSALKSSFKNHQLNHAGKVECHICNRKVIWLRLHMEIHRPKVPCPICQKEFSLKSNMKRHMRTHKEKLQKCEICDELFTKNEDLRRWAFMLACKSDFNKSISGTNCESISPENSMSVIADPFSASNLYSKNISWVMMKRKFRVMSVRSISSLNMPWRIIAKGCSMDQMMEQVN